MRMTDTLTALPTWDMTTIFPAIDSAERDASYARCWDSSISSRPI
jgi:hypothetical protein